MANIQKYGIKYPFESNNIEEIYVDLNDTYSSSIQSQVLHILFTPKGQRLRDPNFGTDLVKFLFDPNDSFTLEQIKTTIRNDISAYIPNVEFNDIRIIDGEGNDVGHTRIINVLYTLKIGNKEIQNDVAVRLQ